MTNEPVALFRFLSIFTLFIVLKWSQKEMKNLTPFSFRFSLRFIKFYEMKRRRNGVGLMNLTLGWEWENR